jgi:hypothetical protein
VLPKRWIVERTLAWISRCCRLARDDERHARKAAAIVRLAMIRLRRRRLAARPRSKIQPSRIGSKSIDLGTLARYPEFVTWKSKQKSGDEPLASDTAAPMK